MKIKILFLLFFLSLNSYCQLLQWNTFGNIGTETTEPSVVNDINISSSNLTFGVGVTPTANGNRFGGNNWWNTGDSSPSTLAQAITGNDYIQFTVTPNAGFAFTPTSFVFSWDRSGSGPTAVTLRSSVDGFVADLGTVTAMPASLSTGNTITISGLIDRTVATTFRLYGYGGTLTSGTGGFDTAATGINVVLNGSTVSTSACSTPSSQATGIITSNVVTTTLDLAWTPGATATGTIVVIRPAASGNTVPVSGTNYNPNTAIGSAGQIDVNNLVIYRSNGSSVTGISGLTAGTQYTVTVYAYNGSGTNICYNTTNPESFTFFTLALEPTGFGAGFTGCGVATLSSIRVDFAAASTIPASGYALFYRQGAAPTGLPTDGFIYPGGTVIGDATFVAYIAPGTVFRNVTGLNAGSSYFFILIPYNAAAGPDSTNYRTVATIPSLTCNTSAAPEINVKGVIGSNPTIADGDITPQGTDNTLFATVVVGGNQAKNFRIENTGNAVLNITSITMVGGTAPLEFVVSGITLPTTIAGGTFLDFTVTFSPTAAGTRNTTLTIVNNDSNEASYDYVIQGTGSLTALVEMNVKGNGQSIPDNSIYPIGTNFTAFGVATVGVTTVVRTFTIESLGSTPLNLTGTPFVTITGPHASMFSVTLQPSASSIAPSTSLTFDVTFNPTLPGYKNATIVIANDDSDENPYNFNISGTAKGANNIYVYGNGNDVVKGATTTILTNLTNFGSAAVTTGLKQNTFVISNLAGATRYLSNVTISGADAAMFTVIAQPNNGAISDGNTTAFTINFTPSSIGIKNATVTFNVYTNSAKTTPEPIDPIFTFAISGNGIVYTTCANGAIQTIAQQDFELAPAAPVWNYTQITDGTVTLAGGTYNNGSGARNAFIGARALHFISTANAVTRTASLTLNSIDVSQYNNINFSFKVAAFRVSGTTQGLDINELIQVETSIDGGINWSVESVLRGYVNSRWDFTATGVFNAYYTGNNNGSTIDTRNGNAELANGIATYNVKNLPSSTNLMIRISMQIDRTDELWAIDNVKIEGQIANSTTWNGLAWSVGVPTTSTKAIFDGNYNTTTSTFPTPGSIEACECQIKTGRIVDVATNDYFEIQSNIYNDGALNIANNGSLIQINDDAINTGTISYSRVANIRLSDYVYWSSPLAGFNVNTISPSSPTSLIWKWDAAIANTNGGFGNWVNASGNTMDAGKGYIVRGPNTFNDTAAQSLTATFSGGKQNNGIIVVPISRGGNITPTTTGTNGITITNNDDNWNLIGNPYPSSIKVSDFLTLNTNIEGAVRLWTHGTLPSTAIPNPFYGSFLSNYTPNDYITHNGVGTVSGPAGFNGYIAGGQGFFVLMNDGVAATQNIIFNNLLRNKTYNNSQFYRTSQTTQNTNEERNRIWLDLVNSNNQSVRTLIGYVDGATVSKDRMFDAYINVGPYQNIFSILDGENMAIQGRPVPFNPEDQVVLGVKIPVAGNYNIAISAVDGLFTENQSIYLEDRLLNIIYDIRQSPYSFSATSGVFTNRFVLRYTNSTLGNPTFDYNNNVIIATSNNQITIKSIIDKMTAVTIYDILGRKIVSKDNVIENEIIFNNVNAKNQALIVKIKLENGQIVTKKIVL